MKASNVFFGWFVASAAPAAVLVWLACQNYAHPISDAQIARGAPEDTLGFGRTQLFVTIALPFLAWLALASKAVKVSTSKAQKALCLHGHRRGRSRCEPRRHILRARTSCVPVKDTVAGAQPTVGPDGLAFGEPVLSMTGDATVRPQTVGRAVLLLYTSFVMGIVRGGLEAQHIAANAPLGFVLATSSLILLISVLLVYLIGVGRAWARNTFLILFVVGLPVSVGPLVRSFAASPLSGILGLIQIVLQAYALVLLFQRPASNWFGAVRHANRTA
jgi:hypothetical protein